MEHFVACSGSPLVRDGLPAFVKLAYYLSIPKSSTVAPLKVWEWLNNVTPQIIMDVITYPCWD